MDTVFLELQHANIYSLSELFIIQSSSNKLRLQTVTDSRQSTEVHKTGDYRRLILILVSLHCAPQSYKNDEFCQSERLEKYHIVLQTQHGSRLV